MIELDYLATWCAMEKLMDGSLVKNIGVSNFNIQELKRLLENCTIKPVNLQVSFRPWIRSYINIVISL